MENIKLAVIGSDMSVCRWHGCLRRVILWSGMM